MSTKKNNPKTALAGSLQSSSTSLITTGGEGDLFPTSNFKISIREFDTDGITVIKREIIHVTSRNGDILSGLTRAFESCVQNDAPTSGVKTSTQVAQSFSSGAQVFQSVTAGDFNGINEDISSKAGKNEAETITEQYDFEKGLTHGTLIDLGTPADWDDIFVGGFYRLYLGSSSLNGPNDDTGTWFLEVLRSSTTSEYYHQRATTSGYQNTGNQTWTRSCVAGNWTAWEQFIVGGVPKLSDTADLRGTQKNPIDYLKTFTLEFFSNTDVNFSITGNHSVVTISPFNSIISNRVHQTLYSQYDGEIYRRYSTSSTTWSDWENQDGSAKSDTIDISRTMGFASGSTTYSHNLGRIPKRITIKGVAKTDNSANGSFCDGVHDVTSGLSDCLDWGYYNEGNQSTNFLYISQGSSSNQYHSGNITSVTSTTFTIDWVNGGGSQSETIKCKATVS